MSTALIFQESYSSFSFTHLLTLWYWVRSINSLHCLLLKNIDSNNVCFTRLTFSILFSSDYKYKASSFGIYTVSLPYIKPLFGQTMLTCFIISSKLFVSMLIWLTCLPAAVFSVRIFQEMFLGGIICICND